MENTALREVLESWNFWNKPLTSNEIGFIRTDYIKEIKSFLSLREIVTLKGIRRSGKSTLMYQTIDELLKEGNKPEDMLYINFEDYRLTNYLSVNLLEQIYQLYREQINPEGFAYFFLDEIQNIPEFERWLRTYYDQKKDMKLFISGSSSTLLSEELSNLLTGRNISIEVYPFNFKEFLQTQGVKFHVKKGDYSETYFKNLYHKAKIKNLLLKYLKNGGFPEIVFLKEESNRQKLLNQYFDDIIFKDIIKRHDIRRTKHVFDIALYCLSNIGTTLSYNNIAKLQELSTNTVIEILRLLQNAYLLFSVRHFGYSTKEKINLQRPRKIYCSDLGMQNALTFSSTEDIGKKVENVIFQHFKDKKEVYYWKELNEVDFIYGKKGIPIEVTYTDTITEKEIKGVLAFLEKYNKNEGFVISNDKFDTLRFKNKTIRTIPLWVWLLIQDS